MGEMTFIGPNQSGLLHRFPLRQTISPLEWIGLKKSPSGWNTNETFRRPVRGTTCPIEWYH